jgi:hypothetical protein
MKGEGQKCWPNFWSDLLNSQERAPNRLKLGGTTICSDLYRGILTVGLILP